MTLIPNWRSAWRMASVQISLLAVLFAALPEDQQAAILALLGVSPERIPGVLGLAIIAARLINQPATRHDQTNLPQRGNHPEGTQP